MKRLALLLAISALGALLLSVSSAGAYYSGFPTAGNPLAGHPWYVDRERSSWWVALRTSPGGGALAAAANNPMGKTIGSFVHNPAVTTRDYIRRAERSQPGSIPFLNLARLEQPSCPFHNLPESSESKVDQWVRGFSRGVGDSRVFVILETDKLTTIRCLPQWAQARRFRELSYEVQTLRSNNPNSIVYIDAGAADWGKDAATIAHWLRNADVADAQGFALNTSHHDWTSREVSFGLAISRRLGDKHFVVNTNTNGWGPHPHGHTSVSAYYHWGCTPPGEGLGIEPTVRTPDPRLDAFIWSGTPGFEMGDCLGLGHGSPYTFYVQEAISLAQNENPRPGS
jgi:endoglucanase